MSPPSFIAPERPKMITNCIVGRPCEGFVLGLPKPIVPLRNLQNCLSHGSRVSLLPSQPPENRSSLQTMCIHWHCSRLVKTHKSYTVGDLWAHSG